MLTDEQTEELDRKINEAYVLKDSMITLKERLHNCMSTATNLGNNMLCARPNTEASLIYRTDLNLQVVKAMLVSLSNVERETQEMKAKIIEFIGEEKQETVKQPVKEKVAESLRLDEDDTFKDDDLPF